MYKDQLVIKTTFASPASLGMVLFAVKPLPHTIGMKPDLTFV